MKKIHSKMKAQEWSQHFSNLDAQGQLTPQFLVGSCGILNSSEILCLVTCFNQKVFSPHDNRYVCMEIRVLIRSGPNPNAALPDPNDALDEI